MLIEHLTKKYSYLKVNFISSETGKKIPPQIMRVMRGNYIRFYFFTAKDISIAANNGDKIALATFEYTGKLLGQKIAEAAAYISPEAVFLFGGLAQAGDLIFKPTQKYMEEFMLNIYKNKIKLLPSSVAGSNAAVLGSSALVWKELENPRKKN